MRVVIVGAGPSGLYLAALLRLIDPSGDVVVFGRRPRDVADPWGIAFSEASLMRLRVAEPVTYDRVAEHFERWDAIDVFARGHHVRSVGHPFFGVARRTLLRALAERADALGADVRYGQAIEDLAALDALDLGDVDLVVAADGARSMLREQYAEHFHPDVSERPAYHACFLTTKQFPASTFVFVEREGGVVQARAFPFDGQHSQVIVQCDPETWRAERFDRLDVASATAACDALLAPWLDGHPLLHPAPAPNAPLWRRFRCVANDRWHHGRLVLLGDAAHTAHFSTGLDATLAMEDALGLALALGEGGPDEASLAAYEAERKAEALRHQTIVGGAMEWFENAHRYLSLPPEQFAYALVARSQGVGHESLRSRDAAFLDPVERQLAGMNATASADTTPADPPPPPPMFTPFQVGALTVPNRVVVAPMDVFSADDGTPNDFHVAHYGARAFGGAGLVMTEMVAVSADGRVSVGSAGLYRPEHVEAWRRVTDVVHRWSPAKIGVQLGHAGPRGATRPPWEGSDQPLGADGWETIAPSPRAYRSGMRTPREMTRVDMERVRDDFARAARLAVEAGFDLLEVNYAHGMLLSAFLTPLLNRRTDDYGGSLENRLRFPLEVFAAVRAAWPADRPVSVCLSVTDWIDGGVDAEEGVAIARAFRDAGADIVHVSAGHTSPDARPVYGRMFQTPLADRVRNEVGVPTIAVGNITDADQVNAIVAAGRADLCALGRPHLTNPHWTLHAAADPRWPGQWWPVQYERGRAQLERELQHRVDMLEAGTL